MRISDWSSDVCSSDLGWLYCARWPPAPHARRLANRIQNLHGKQNRMITSLSLLSAAPARLDPLQLFMQADVMVQAVMTGLILASIWVWMIIVSFSLRMGGLETASRKFEEDFWEAEEIGSAPV